jgi:hypothetical protein
MATRPLCIEHARAVRAAGGRRVLASSIGAPQLADATEHGDFELSMPRNSDPVSEALMARWRRSFLAEMLLMLRGGR